MYERIIKKQIQEKTERFLSAITGKFYYSNPKIICYQTSSDTYPEWEESISFDIEFETLTHEFDKVSGFVWFDGVEIVSYKIGNQVTFTRDGFTYTEM